MRELEIDAVPHGFRSSFRDLGRRVHRRAAGGLRDRPWAHVNNDRTEAAYRRTDLFERRRTLMQQWPD